MKFIPLFFVFGCIAVSSQITTTGSATVYVSSGTTVYSTDDITLASDTGLFTNKGNIKISTGTLVNNATSDKFVLAYTSESSYGQLIIASATATTGSITMQKLLPDAGTTFAYFGTPFVNYTYDQFTADVTGSSTATSPDIVCGLFGVNNNCKNNPDRWNRQPIYVWREDRFRYDPYQGENFTPGKYYTIRKANFTTLGATFTNNISFIGSPYVAGTNPSTGGTATSSALTVSVANRITNGYNIGNAKRNEYGIFYYTYLNDPFATSIDTFSATTTDTALNTDTSTARYGDRMIHLVNPYTSNLDLKVLTSDYTNVIGIGSEGPISTYSDSKTRYTEKIQSYLTAGIGDDLRLIPPMTNFFIKASADGLSFNLYTDSSAQTFDYGGYVFDNGTLSKSSDNSKVSINGSSTSKSYTSDKYQVNLKLFSGETLYGNTYVAAGSDLITGALNSSEARNNNNLTDGTNIYTIPEAETGGIAPGHEDSKLYINVINTDASKVAIPVGVNVVDEDKGKEFTFKSDLKFNMSSLDKEKTNFDGSDEKFYFYDKETNIVKEIDTNFSYSVVLNESTNNRFEIFWKETGTLSNEDINALSGLTTVYKTGSEYKVRFNKNWQKAEVNVFSVLGQLISSEKNISTQDDYLLPIYNSSSSMYVVVVINSVTGEKITKKIVK